jgi:hypothetical protein
LSFWQFSRFVGWLAQCADKTKKRHIHKENHDEVFFALRSSFFVLDGNDIVIYGDRCYEKKEGCDFFGGGHGARKGLCGPQAKAFKSCPISDNNALRRS